MWEKALIPAVHPGLPPVCSPLVATVVFDNADLIILSMEILPGFSFARWLGIKVTTVAHQPFVLCPRCSPPPPPESHSLSLPSVPDSPGLQSFLTVHFLGPEYCLRSSSLSSDSTHHGNQSLPTSSQCKHVYPREILQYPQNPFPDCRHSQRLHCAVTDLYEAGRRRPSFLNFSTCNTSLHLSELDLQEITWQMPTHDMHRFFQDQVTTRVRLLEEERNDCPQGGKFPH